ncbi:hypothetical protein [Enterococcus innesii]
MAIDLWRHFKKGLTVYIGIGIAVSFLSAADEIIELKKTQVVAASS